MQFFDNVKIPVFGENAEKTAYVAPSNSEKSGVYFSDEDWLNTTNITRTLGVVEGIARSVDYNTVMRQCSMFASLFANILAYRNSLARSGQGPAYGNSLTATIGTTILGTEGDMAGHIGALSEIFSTANFLADSEVSTRTIQNSAVTTEKINNSAVTTEKINQDAVVRSKLGSNLIASGTSTQNGIKVTLSQGIEAGNHGFSVKVESSKVNNAVQSDNSTNADNVKTTTSAGTFYLCGTARTDANTYKGVVNSKAVYVSGGSQINATDFNVTSDRRLKDNIRDIGENQVKHIVENVKVKLFNYKETPNRTTVGVIAQDIKEQNSPLADLLVCDLQDAEGKPTGMLGIHEDKLVYVLWNYIQQQNQKIEELSKRVDELSK